MMDKRAAMSREQALAVMAAIELETIERCCTAVHGYIERKSKKSGTSRIAAAKVEAARELFELISTLPRKSKESRNGRQG